MATQHHEEITATTGLPVDAQLGKQVIADYCQRTGADEPAALRAITDLLDSQSFTSQDIAEVLLPLLGQNDSCADFAAHDLNEKVKELLGGATPDVIAAPHEEAYYDGAHPQTIDRETMTRALEAASQQQSAAKTIDQAWRNASSHSLALFKQASPVAERDDSLFGAPPADDAKQQISFRG